VPVHHDFDLRAYRALNSETSSVENDRAHNICMAGGAKDARNQERQASQARLEEGRAALGYPIQKTARNSSRRSATQQALEITVAPVGRQPR
jgi:hypothetical protein